MNMIEFRNTVVELLNTYIDRPVIFIPVEKEMPNYPFVTYAVLNTSVKDDTGYIKRIEDVDGWIIERKVQQIQHVLSFNAYGNDSFEVKDLIKKCQDYFNHVGTVHLSDERIIVVSSTDIENRDLLDVDEYERKEGFDVTFRVTDIIDRRIEAIEQYAVEEN